MTQPSDDNTVHEMVTDFDDLPARAEARPIPRMLTERLPPSLIDAPLPSLTVTSAPAEIDDRSGPLLRADEAAFDEDALLLPMAAEEPAVSAPAAAPVFDDRSTVLQRLEHELSAAERRLFPNTPPHHATRDKHDEDALGDIDLDALRIDTLPNLGADALDLPLLRQAPTPPNGHAAARPPKVGETEGNLATEDIAALLAKLHASQWRGRLILTFGEGEKSIYFDDGAPVSATSNLPHDRFAELLVREGRLTRSARFGDLAALAPSAPRWIESGLLKPGELIAMRRRHVEEILYSTFAWQAACYRLSDEQAAMHERVQLLAHPWALVLEGVRCKYHLERLVQLVGPLETVLSPTERLARAIIDGRLRAAEQARAELIDGRRSLGELLHIGGAPALSEIGLYALGWGLIAIGAVRPGADAAATRAVGREQVTAKHALVRDGDYFSVLGLSREASAYEIDRAFERLSREYAPERFNDSLLAELGDVLAEISDVLAEAHRVLSDEHLRTRYRARLGA
jgi:hypothetical protein